MQKLKFVCQLLALYTGNLSSSVFSCKFGRSFFFNWLKICLYLFQSPTGHQPENIGDNKNNWATKSNAKTVAF